jgi:O-antigen/teichoic acid export membrane protein
VYKRQLLIPKYSIIGAALAALLGNIFFVACGLIAARSLARGWFAHAYTSLAGIALSGIIMGGVVWYSTHHIHFIFSIGLGAVTYVSCLFLFRVVSVTSLKSMLSRSQ